MATKLITVLKRTEIKKASESYSVIPGDIINLVREGSNVHMVTLRRNKRHSCTCHVNAQWNCSCRHISFSRTEENARYDAMKAVAEAENIVTAKGSDNTSTVSSQPVLSEVVDHHGTEGTDKAASQGPTQYELDQLNTLLPGFNHCILKNGEFRYPCFKGADGWQMYTDESGQLVRCTTKRSADKFIAEQKKGVTVDRQAQIEEAKKEILLEEEIARRLSLLKSEKMDGLKFIAYNRGLAIRSRKRIDYINAIIADVRKSLESNTVAA